MRWAAKGAARRCPGLLVAQSAAGNAACLTGRQCVLLDGEVGCGDDGAVAKTLFESIGYALGHKAAQAKNAFDLVGGTEEESSRAEIRLGRELAAALLERVPLVEENAVTRFAAEVGGWLASHVKEKALPFSFRVTAEREPNALALPGGPVFVSWPLLELCQGERDEIAFMLGHEMAHIARRHTLDRIVKDAAVSLLLRQMASKQAASAWLSTAGRQLLSRAFSREDELEADDFAVALIRTAGGDALAGERLLDKLAQATSGPSGGMAGDYFATHPPLTDRLANLRARRPG
jgi:beta-barrel assembly-enhancing protease